MEDTESLVTKLCVASHESNPKGYSTNFREILFNRGSSKDSKLVWSPLIETSSALGKL